MFKDILIKLMDNSKISAYKLSKETSIPDSLLSNYRTGKKTPTSENLIKISQYFNVSTDYLLGLTDNQNQTITNFTENEQDILKILHSIPDERQQAKFIGYMEAESKKYVNASNGIADDITETLKQAQDSQAVTKQK